MPFKSFTAVSPNGILAMGGDDHLKSMRFKGSLSQALITGVVRYLSAIPRAITVTYLQKDEVLCVISPNILKNLLKFLMNFS